MQKIQIFLRKDQKDKLKRLAAMKGVTQSDLVRRGIDLVLAEDTGDDDWKRATRELFGLWKDHESVDEVIREVRSGLSRRHEKLEA